MNRVDETSTRVWLWFAFLAGPLAWTAHELLSYAFVKVACTNGLSVLEPLTTLGALVIVCAGGFIAMRVHGGRIGAAHDTPDFLAAAAIVLNALFALAIVMEAIPNAVVSPCL